MASSPTLRTSKTMMFPATAALEQFQSEDDSVSETTSSALDFDTNNLFEELLVVESPQNLPFPTIAWPEEEASFSQSKKDFPRKALRRTKHRNMVRSKSHYRGLSGLGESCWSFGSSQSLSSLSTF